MKLLDMFKYLGPALYKRDILDTLYNTKRELEDTTIPIYKQFDNQFSNWDFKSKEVKRLIPTFNALVKKRQGNIITTVKYVLIQLDKTLQDATNHYEKTFKDTTASSSITYRKMQYLQFLDSVKFYIGYARDFLNYLLVAETGQYDQGNTLAKSLTPAEIKRVEKGFNDFCQLTNTFNSHDNIFILLSQVPDVSFVPENADIVEASVGKVKIDPLKMNFIGADRNPFYALQVRWALRDHAKYEKAVEERELLKLRLLNLQNSQNGEPDPAIMKEIKYYENRIQKLDFQIAKVEDQYA